MGPPSPPPLKPDRRPCIPNAMYFVRHEFSMEPSLEFTVYTSGQVVMPCLRCRAVLDRDVGSINFMFNVFRNFAISRSDRPQRTTMLWLDRLYHRHRKAMDTGS